METTKKIYSSECNFKLLMSLESILGLNQDLISLTMTEMGCDNVTLRTKYHCMWVYTRNKIHVQRRPRIGEILTLRCNPVTSNRLFAYFKTSFFDEKGNLIIEALTEMCAIDIESYRFIRLTQIPFSFNKNEEKIEYEMQELNYSESYQRVILPSMIDYSMHLNNIKSIPMYFDTFSLEELNDFYSHSFDFTVKYTAQAKFGEHVTLKKGHEGNLYGYTLLDPQGQTILTAQIEYH